MIRIRRSARGRALLAFVFWVSAAPLSPASSCGLDVEEILERVRRATGSVALKKPGTWTMQGEARHLGCPGRVQITFDRAGRFQCAVDGRAGLTLGFDGETVWQEDRSRAARPLAFLEREDTLVTTWILTGLWLDENRFQIEQASSVEDQDPDAPVKLRLRLASGQLQTVVTLDRESWLPVSFAWISSGQTMTATLGEHHAHLGLTLPGHALFQLASGEEYEYRFATVTHVDESHPEVFAPDFSLPEDVSFDPDATAELESRRVPSGHILVRPSLDGEDPGWFVLDSGASVSLVTPEVAEAIEMEAFGEIHLGGAGEDRVAARFRQGAFLRLGPLELEDPIFVEADLGILSSAFGVPIAGVVGYPVFRRSVVHVDLESGDVAIHDPAGPPRENLHWEEVVFSNNHPHLRCRFEDREGHFLLDTGAGTSQVTFHSPAVDRLDLLRNREVVPTVLAGLGGTIPARAGELRSFEVAGRRFERVSATFARTPLGAFADEYGTGLLGGGLLTGFTLVFDYPRLRIGFVARE